eukprot:2464131-Rhodomonas_salina.1
MGREGREKGVGDEEGGACPHGVAEIPARQVAPLRAEVAVGGDCHSVALVVLVLVDCCDCCHQCVEQGCGGFQS